MDAALKQMSLKGSTALMDYPIHRVGELLFHCVAHSADFLPHPSSRKAEHHYHCCGLWKERSPPTSCGGGRISFSEPCDINELQRAFAGKLSYLKIMSIPHKVGHPIHTHRSCAVNKTQPC